MKNILVIVLLLQIFGCFTKYGMAMETKKTNDIPSMPHINYELNKNEMEVPIV